jgi:hypothetical protein
MTYDVIGRLRGHEQLYALSINARIIELHNTELLQLGACLNQQNCAKEQMPSEIILYEQRGRLSQ